MPIQDKEVGDTIMAGVKDLQPVIRVTVNGNIITFLPKISILVETKNKGVHMSRLIESMMLGWLETSNIGKLEDLGLTILKYVTKRKKLIGCEDRVVIEIEGTYIYELMEPSEVLIKTIKDGEEVRNFVGVRVRCMNACPCVLDETNGKFTHMQGVNITVFKENGSISELIKIVEEHVTPTRTLLKRDEEVKLVEKAYSTPLFVEDIVRELKEHVDCVYVESEESIHKHKAVGLWKAERN